jgi:C_GCAxxG_C_C family probable redox protein
VDWNRIFAYEEISKLSEENILEQAYETGFEYEKTRYGCSQCVIAALEKVFKFNFPDLVKASFPLAGGGVNSTEGTCGALVGGLLVIGFMFGRDREEFLKNQFNRKSLEIGDVLFQQFMNEYGSILCKDIQRKIFGRNFNLKDPKEKEAFEQAGGHENKCPSVVGKSCSWTAKIILEQIK